jgi:transcriptional regulator with GAF, ATPase, and Fis domain
MMAVIEHCCRVRTMESVLDAGRLAAESDSTVLWLGESGSGKDYLARRMHQSSRRKDAPFLSINCSALPPDLMESELFGHERGAFTSAWERKVGLIGAARGGTLLLNEIGEMPMHLQPKLLTFLDTHYFRRVGGTDFIPADVRIMAATNQDLQSMLTTKAFRPDLFFRLSVITMRVPALRDRLEDLPMLTQKFLVELTATMGLGNHPALHRDTLRTMERYGWPGNVRELRNLLERCLILSGGRTQEMNSLIVDEVQDLMASKPKLPTSTGNAVIPPIIEELLREAAGKRVRNPTRVQKERLYQECMVGRGWKQKDIAQALGISEATVSNWLSEVRAQSQDFPENQV